MSEDPADENRLIADRRAKLAALRAEAAGAALGGGTPPTSAFPNDFRRDAVAAELHAAFGERSIEWLEAHPTRVRVAGRMLFKRVMGRRASPWVRSSAPARGSCRCGSRACGCW